MKLKLLISLLLLSNLAFSATNLSLTDKCSGKEVALYSYNGMNITLSIDDFDPYDEMIIKYEFYPVSMVDEAVNNAPYKIIYKYSEASEKRGLLGRRRILPTDKFVTRLKTPRKSKLRKLEKRFQASRLWTVRVSWYQLNANKGGVVQKSFLNVFGKKSFYEIKSAGMCHWESEPSVSSKLYDNHSMTFMNIIREYTGISSWQSSPSVSLGPNNNVGQTPLAWGDNSGWLFKEWGMITGEDHLNTLQRTWILNRHESGVFATRHSFSRKKVKRWTWLEADDSHCMEYRPVSEGYLDIGKVTEDFYILPKEMYSTQEMNTFITKYRPTLDTCSNNVSKGPQNADDIIINANKSILYYYTQRDLL